MDRQALAERDVAGTHLGHYLIHEKIGQVRSSTILIVMRAPTFSLPSTCPVHLWLSD